MPLHNSYDPYDSNIGTGHNFDQFSWAITKTTHAFAKGNKLVHQKPIENPEDPTYSFHICGFKFDDFNRNGIFDIETEHGIDGVTVTLLAPDPTDPSKLIKAELAYPEIIYPSPEANPLKIGENMLTGSYCFNIENLIDGKTYTFYIKIEEPSSSFATTLLQIGPITLVASEGGPRDSINNNFGNVAPAVGGVFTTPNRLLLLSPYVALVGLVGALSIILAVRRRCKA